MKTGIKLERGDSVRQRLSRRLKTKRSDVLTLKNLSGRAAAPFREPRAEDRGLLAAPLFSDTVRRPCAMAVFGESDTMCPHDRRCAFVLAG